MTRTRIAAMLAVSALLPLAAGGCSDIRSAMGLEKNAPDEFNVVSRAPLSLPPDYNLRPPREGGDYITERDTRARARQAVFGGQQETDPYANDPNKSPGEAALLTRAGAGTVDPDIRRRVKQETESIANEDEGFVEQLIFWRKKGDEADVVNAGEEDQRLREARALGETPSSGSGGAPYGQATGGYGQSGAANPYSVTRSDLEANPPQYPAVGGATQGYGGQANPYGGQGGSQGQAPSGGNGYATPAPQPQADPYGSASPNPYAAPAPVPTPAPSSSVNPYALPNGGGSQGNGSQGSSSQGNGSQGGGAQGGGTQAGGPLPTPGSAGQSGPQFENDLPPLLEGSGNNNY